MVLDQKVMSMIWLIGSCEDAISLAPDNELLTWIFRIKKLTYTVLPESAINKRFS